MSDADLVVVHVLELPLPVHARAQEHGDALVREFRLIAEQLREEPETAKAVPVRLLELTEALTAQYSSFTVEQEDAIENAVAEGLPSLDLTFTVPRHAGEAAVALGRMLDDADAYCREGVHLLTLATPDDLVLYRRWYLDEFVRQCAGARPRPWPEYARATGGVVAAG